MSKADQIGLIVSLVFHLLVIAFSMYYTFQKDQRPRTSFIEVTLGDYQTGTLAEYAKEENTEVRTRPDPSKVETNEPEPENPTPVEREQTESEETTKSVDLPDQQEEVEEQEVKTPDTKKVDPEQKKSTEEQETEIAPEARKDEEKTEGAKTSGDERGTTGDVNADQGTGTDTDKSAPYELKWEGDIERSPKIRPLPDYNAEVEARITVRFQVKPDGSVGQIIPLVKGNPELEREVLRTLKSWRFSRLPSGVPQRSQWGTITFRFVFD